MIKIAIDGGDYGPGSILKSGISRILDNYLKFASRNKKYDLKLCSFNKSYHSRLPQKFFSELSLPLRTITSDASAFLGFSSHLPFLLRFFKLLKIIFVYDLGFIRFPNLYHSPEKLKKRLEFSYRYADVIIVPSEYVKAELQNYLSPKNQKIKVIHFGIDHLESSRHKSPYDFPYFLYVGVIKPIKNIERIFTLFKSFHNNSNNIKCRLILIGNQEKDYLNSLKSTKDYEDLKKFIVFQTTVTDDELTAHYQHALGLLNFSKVEGYAFTVLEAARLGVPTIVNDLPLYHEYKQTFPTIYIGNNDHSLFKHMMMVTHFRSQKEIVVTPPKFTWKAYEREIDELIVSTLAQRIGK